MAENKYSCYQCEHRQFCYLFHDLKKIILGAGTSAFLNFDTGEELEKIFQPVAKYCKNYNFQKEK